MSGDIWITKNNHWMAASHMFYWVIEFLIANIDDTEIVQKLQVIADNNLQLIDFDEFSPEQRLKITEVLTTQLVPDARRRLHGDISERSRIDLFWELSARAKLGSKWGKGASL
jgi:hypothetical protein